MAFPRKKYKSSFQEKATWTVFMILALLVIFGFIWAIRIVLFSSVTDPCIDDVPDVLSFEDPSELDYFTHPGTSTLMTSSRHYKDGFHSLVWHWGPGDELQLKLRRRLSRCRAGIEFWIYKNKSSVANLTVSLIDSALPSNESVVLRFKFSLNFTGWRAAWVALREAFSNDSCPEKVGYDQIKFTAPAEKIPSQMIFLDLLCFTRKVTYQSRDQIVPPINGSIYDITATWQQTYRWSLVNPPEVNGTAPLSAKEIQQLSELYLIEKRLVTWFANESVSPMEFRGNILIRWKYFLRHTLRKARRYLKHLNITVSKDGVITGSPLFIKRSKFGKSITEKGGNKKLADAAYLVLFPLTLEYYFSINPRYIHKTIARELANMNSIFRRKIAIRRIANYDREYTKFLLSQLANFKTPITPSKLRQILGNLNQRKLDTIMLLLRYIANQGWTEGSAMGSLDHVMNQVGTGFVHSMFLLRKQLAEAGKLETVLNTMKWYNDMGEIYQRNFEHSGTTADRLRTIIVYRLQIILMNRGQTIHEKRAKIRDMSAYVRWCNNALLVHPALLPTFKPDLSCFHHLGIYGSAYTPEALLQSSMIWYFLHGTSFSLDTRSKVTIRDRLFSKERMAPLYSAPNSISGRFPNYSNVILVLMLPAYAFFSIHPQNLTESGHLQEVSLGNDTEIVRVFLRLYRPSYPQIRKIIRSGNRDEDINYISSIGSLQLIEALYRKAKEAEIQAAAPQTGHWVQNFAALSIHRREHWVVSVKGFSRYIWDFERSPTENVYGLYQSHGALQISNSERSLRAYNVDHGWDWTRVPGTTTIRLSLKEMMEPSDGRYYQHSKLVGGVVLSSKNARFSNGVFAMRFQRPSYGPRYGNNDAEQEIEFTFKKSVFFYNSLLVCLGSDISVRNSEPNITQTTLFQDKQVNGISSIYLNGTFKWLNDNYSQFLNDSAAMLDTNGNGYYIPKGSLANVAISRQTSRTNDGQSVSSARYAVVWLDHGINPVSASYEYAILVASDVSSIEDLRRAQTSDTPIYEVLYKNYAAHVVRFAGNDTATPSVTYGYAFFNVDAVHLGIEGPVSGVSAQCLVMAEIDASNFSNINLSISSPDLNYNTTKVLNISTENGVNEYFYMRSQPVERSVYLSKAVLLQRLLVNGKTLEASQHDQYITVRTEYPQHPTFGGSEIVFKNLVNGESVEVHLMTSKPREINS